MKLSKKQLADSKKLAKRIMVNMDIDCMNLWIAQTNDLRYMLLYCGIEPGYGELKPVPYPK